MCVKRPSIQRRKLNLVLTVGTNQAHGRGSGVRVRVRVRVGKGKKNVRSGISLRSRSLSAIVRRKGIVVSNVERVRVRVTRHSPPVEASDEIESRFI